MACERIGRDPSSLRRSTVQTLCAGDAAADRECRAVRIGVPLSELEGLIGDESDIRSRVADFQAAGVDRLYVEILDLANFDHLDYFASAVGLRGAARDDVEPVQTE